MRNLLRFFPTPVFALEERLGGSRDEAAVRGPSASSSLLSGKRNEAAARCRLLGGTSSSLLSTVAAAARFRPGPLALKTRQRQQQTTLARSRRARVEGAPARRAGKGVWQGKGVWDKAKGL